MGLDFAFLHALEMGEVARARVLAKRAYETVKLHEGEDSEATKKAKEKMEGDLKNREEFGALSGGQVNEEPEPKVLAEEEFEKWLWMLERSTSRIGPSELFTRETGTKRDV